MFRTIYRLLIAVTMFVTAVLVTVFIFNSNPFKTWLDYIAFPIGVCFIFGCAVAMYFVFTCIYDFLDSFKISYKSNDK